MDADKIFVGRKEELEQFKQVLEDPQGQAVLVVGQAGMGKTWLVNKMAEIALKHPDLKCGFVRYEVTPTDSVDSTMALMMDNAFEAANTQPGSFDKVPERKKQWLALFKTVVPKGGEIAELVNSLKRDPVKNTREQFIERLRLISKRMPDSGRAIFIIDPEYYMQKDSDQSWAIVVKDLPEKIKFVFPQRPEDELAKGRAFKGLQNVLLIPDERLGILRESDVEELVRLRADDVGQSGDILNKTVKRYRGHPYAIVGALEIVKKTKSVENLPQDPTPEAIAEGQWERVCDSGNEAIALFEAYAVLEVGVPDDVVRIVSGISVKTRKRLQKDSYLKGLLREEGEGKRIYHAILADYILGQIGEDEKKEYHSRAVGIYRGKLAKAKKEQTKPDALAAMRLAEHVLTVEGKEAFVKVVLNESGKVLTNLGLLDSVENVLLRALGMVEKDSGEESLVLCNLGNIYEIRGDLDKAEEVYKKSLEFSEPREMLKLTATLYGNLGIVYFDKGEFDKAKEMHHKALEIDEKLGNKEGTARHYGNLGNIYVKQGYLDKAKEAYKKSLDISVPHGMADLTANQYGNLGNVYFDQGEFDKAKEMYLKALDIDEKLGNKEGMAIQYGNLGGIYMSRGDIDKAEEMLNKTVEIHEKIGHKGGLANANKNFGLIYGQRGDIEKAREYWEKALELYKKIGMKPDVEIVEGWIDGIEDK